MKNIYSTKAGNIKNIFEADRTSQIHIVLSVNCAVVEGIDSEIF